jgi:ribonuclease HII
MGQASNGRFGPPEVAVSSYKGAPTLSEEIRAWRSGFRHVAGIDEVGRGPMAGPVVAAAVILDPHLAADWWSELRDSKLLTAARRRQLDAYIRETASYGIGSATHAEIDAHGLLVATRQAMLRALAVLPKRPDLILIDAVALPEGGDHIPIIHGDALSASIAAASVIAKVERDRLMDAYDLEYPLYGFGHNRGYCTPDHLRALSEYGPCAIHRRSFAPVRSYLEGRQQPLPLDR